MSETDTITQDPRLKSFRPSNVSLVLAFTALLMGGLVSDFVAYALQAVYAGTVVEADTNLANFRKPVNDGELKYWLENMVWYHRFTNEEIRAATGLTEKETVSALKKFNIQKDNRPKRAEDGPLLVGMISRCPT